MSPTTNSKVYRIEPGDWEAATGESVEKDVHVRVLPGECSLCEWEWDDTHCKWDSDCGNAFQLISGTPTENEMQFCPYCGKQISERWR